MTTPIFLTPNDPAGEVMKCDRNALLAIYVPKLTKKESRALVEEVTIVVKKALKRLRQKNRRATKKKS